MDHASSIMNCTAAEIWYVDCSHKYKMNQGVMVGRRQPLVEDNLWWKTPLLEDDIWWKTTLGGRRLSVEDDLQWKMTFGGRRPTVEDDLRWKTTFSI